MLRLPVVLLAMLLSSLLVRPAVAQEVTLSAEIVAGECASDELVARLTEAIVPSGDVVGASSGRVAASSFTSVALSFALLTSEPHAIRSGEVCGAIGGELNADGALILVLAGPDGDSGIAYLSPDPADSALTNVSLFLAPPADASPSQSRETPDTADVEAPAPTAQIAPTALPTPTALPEPTPEPEPTGRSESAPAPIGTSLTHEDGLTITPLSAYFSYGYGFSTPKGGYTYLVLEAQIQNNGDSSEPYSYVNFSGRDLVSGAGYDAVWILADGMLDLGDLDPGEYVSGTVVLEVQETATQVLIKYDPTMFDPNDLYWQVGQ